MNGLQILEPGPAGFSFVPEDLAEISGAVRLMHVALEAAQAAEPPPMRCGEDGKPLAQLLTLYTYALARNWVGSEEIVARVPEDGCLRYLAGRPFPTAEGLRRFRRDHPALVRSAFAYLVSRVLGQVDALPRLGFDPRGEASRRFARAVEADSLALEG